jgi:hypothetical protein
MGGSRATRLEVYKTRWAAKPVWQPPVSPKTIKNKRNDCFFQNLNYKFYEQKLINRSVFN